CIVECADLCDFFFFQAEDGIRDFHVTGVQTCALPIYNRNSYENPKSDELIMAAASTVDREERVRLYHEWQEVIAQDVPHLWIGNPDEVTAYSAGLVVPDLPTNYLRWRKVGDWFWSE